MTREEALEVLIVKANKGDFVKDIINQIFDEHEAEIQQLQLALRAKEQIIDKKVFDIRAKDEEIAKLKRTIDSAIIRVLKDPSAMGCVPMYKLKDSK